jgi:ribosome-binding factor A
MSLRPERIADYLKKEISNIILQKVRDPRLKSIVINHISVTPDITSAKVFYSVYQDKTELNEKILSKFSGMIRSEISKSMKIKRVPKSIFIFDDRPLSLLTKKIPEFI